MEPLTAQELTKIAWSSDISEMLERAEAAREAGADPRKIALVKTKLEEASLWFAAAVGGK